MTGPYATAAETYWRAAWRGILPIPERKKAHPPQGFTGAAGASPSYPDIHTWMQGREGNGNIALRMPRHVVGIDVDAYGDKPGAQTLTLAEAAHGVLPPTWRVTSRDDGTSGIRFFRVPEGLAWPGEVGPAIELIHHDYRYAVVWPSIHPEGRTYRWIQPDGVVSTTVPDPDDFPPLPDPWIAAYQQGEAGEPLARVSVEHRTAVEWIVSQPNAMAPPCVRMGKVTERHASDLHGSAHNSTRSAVLSVARLASEGHHGAVTTLAEVRSAFLAAATNPNRDLLGQRRRTLEEAVYEFAELVASAVGVVLATPSDIQTCDCYGQLTGLIAPPLPSGVSIDGTAALAPQPAPAPAAVNVEPAGEPTLIERFIDGGTFILDAPDTLPNVWGSGDESLWAEGEALMICGPPGVGKTTLTGQLVRGLLGLQDTVLGLPVRPTGRVLYLAMDRPAQIARALRRAFHRKERSVLAEKLTFWAGPPPGDVAKHPTVMLSLAQLAEADTVIVDSIKDAAVGLVEDEVGAAYNRARQTCLANGVQVLELHHMVKRGAGGNKPTELADVYGSAWLSAGCGSVVLLWGAAGDPIVDMKHLKQPAAEVGPWRLEHDMITGTTSIFHAHDLLALISDAGYEGTTATALAGLLYEGEQVSTKERDNQVKIVHRKLTKLVKDGLVETFQQAREGRAGGRLQQWFRAANPNTAPNTATPPENPNTANPGPTPRPDDSRSDHNTATTPANTAQGPTPRTPPSLEGGAYGPGQNGHPEPTLIGDQLIDPTTGEILE